MFNMDLAIDVMAHIELGQMDNSWQQQEWGTLRFPGGTDRSDHLVIDNKTDEVLGLGTCSSAFCAAGWAGSLSERARLRYTKNSYSGDLWRLDQLIIDGRERDVWTGACELLGMPYGRRDDYDDGDDPRWDDDEGMPALFLAHNGIDDMYRQFTYWFDDDTTEEEFRERVQTHVQTLIVASAERTKTPVTQATQLC